jgi:Holliday junction resolvase RusA-like endonuclease
MRLTAAQFQAIYGPKTHHHRVSHPKPQRQQAAGMAGQTEGQSGGDERVAVRITSYVVRPLDCDNFTGGCKHLIDCLKERGLIEDDSPRHIKLETDQIQVAHYHEERIEITIE